MNHLLNTCDLRERDVSVSKNHREHKSRDRQTQSPSGAHVRQPDAVNDRVSHANDSESNNRIMGIQTIYMCDAS